MAANIAFQRRARGLDALLPLGSSQEGVDVYEAVRDDSAALTTVLLLQSHVHGPSFCATDSADPRWWDAISNREELTAR